MFLLPVLLFVSFSSAEVALALDFGRVGGNLVGDSWSVEGGSEEPGS